VGGSRLAGAVFLGFIFGLTAVGEAAEPEQFFASVLLDKKKIGQFHVRISRAETGEIEELRARASVSMLGVRLYEFSHDLTQTWRAGELQVLRGVADDNGTKYELQLAREAKNYSGKVNNKAVTLPIEAFPNSIWHYGIVDHALLFNEVDLKFVEGDHHTGERHRRARPEEDPGQKGHDQRRVRGDGLVRPGPEFRDGGVADRRPQGHGETGSLGGSGGACPGTPQVKSRTRPVTTRAMVQIRSRLTQPLRRKARPNQL
jgi:hypothetical protein